MELSMYASNMINPLCEDLELKLKLYSSLYQDESMKYTFEKENHIKIAELIITKNVVDIEGMTDKLSDDVQCKDGKLHIRNNVHNICSQIYKQLYNTHQENAFSLYLDIVQKKLNGNFDCFYKLDFDFEPIKEHFLDHATAYIIENQNKSWIDEFKKIDYSRYSWLKYIETKKIPIKFNTKDELFFWLKKNEQEEVLDFLGLSVLNSLLDTVIEHETYSIHSHALKKNRIIKIIEECSDDYILVGKILTKQNISLNIFFLHFFEYSLFGFLNLYELDSAPHNLKSKHVDYTKNWNSMIAKQMIDIIFLQFSNLQNKKNFSKLIYNILNYMTKDYIIYYSYHYDRSKKIDIFQSFLEEVSTHEIRHNGKTFLLEFAINDLVEKQIKHLDDNNISLHSYYILSFYLTHIERISKLLDTDYNNLFTKITNSVLNNIGDIFKKNLQDDKLYVKFEVLEKIDFALFYELSEDKNKWLGLVDFNKAKNRWAELTKQKSTQSTLSSNDPKEPKNIIKFYFHILLQVYKTHNEKTIAITLNKLAISFGVDIDFGIFHENSWMGHQLTNKLFLKYINILNTFNDEEFNLFFDALYSKQRLRDMLELLNTTDNLKRKDEIVYKIKQYVKDNTFEFNSLFDIRESVLYAQHNDLRELSTILIEHYRKKTSNKKNSHFEKDFLEIVCKKEILDIFYNENFDLDEKFTELKQYKNPFDDRNHGIESKQIKCENYQDFIRAILFFETEPRKTYEILLNLVEKELNSLYLINMVNAYFRRYENDKNEKVKFEYILKKYENYDTQIINREKSLYEYQVLFYGYSKTGNTSKLEKFHQELPNHYKNNIEDYLPNDILIFGKPIIRKSKLLVCFEGEFDIKFIKNINQAVDEYKNIINLENSKISFVPLGGGNLTKWIEKNHLYGSNIIELYIFDSDIGSDKKNAMKYAKECNEVKNRQDNSYCFLSKKRELENYIHKSLIEEEFNIDMSGIREWDTTDIPTYIKNKIRADKNEKIIKEILNGKLSKKMTKELLEEINAFEEIKSWFEKMKELKQL